MICVVPEITVRTLDKNDKFILMGCDGVWEIMTNEEVGKWVSKQIKDGQSKKDILE